MPDARFSRGLERFAASALCLQGDAGFHGIPLRRAFLKRHPAAPGSNLSLCHVFSRNSGLAHSRFLSYNGPCPVKGTVSGKASQETCRPVRDKDADRNFHPGGCGRGVRGVCPIQHVKGPVSRTNWVGTARASRPGRGGSSFTVECVCSSRRSSRMPASSKKDRPAAANLG